MYVHAHFIVQNTATYNIYSYKRLRLQSLLEITIRLVKLDFQLCARSMFSLYGAFKFVAYITLTVLFGMYSV